MAKIGLAAELAKKAAEAAREEMGGGGKIAPKLSAGWKLEALPTDFDVDQALSTAANRVAAHYRQVLGFEGLEVSVTGSGVAGKQQNLPEFKADVREGATGRLVRAYTGPELLSLYARQQRLCGVVVDGIT